MERFRVTFTVGANQLVIYLLLKFYFLFVYLPSFVNFSAILSQEKVENLPRVGGQ